MKKFLIYLILAAISCVWNPCTSNAQKAYKSNIDTDLYLLRNSVMPEFSCAADDYLQYSPAAVMIGLKAFGYQGRSSWGRMLVSDAFSTVGMAVAVKGLKMVVERERPDGSDFESFPSGHTAKAFMAAAMLDKEYGGRSPWFSIGGYSVAALTGVSRLMNNRHWMSDVVAGAAIGIGAVNLGYFITDKIFKDRGLNEGYEEPEFIYDSGRKHYVAELMFGRRYILGEPINGSLIGVSTDIPLIPGTGITAKATAGSLVKTPGDSYELYEQQAGELYSLMAGGYWNHSFAKILEFQAKAMLGSAIHDGKAGFGASAGVSLSLITDNNFKIKAFADYELASRKSAPWLNSVIIGYSASWFW